MVERHDKGWLGANDEYFGTADEAHESLSVARASVASIRALGAVEKRAKDEWLAKVARLHRDSAVRRSALVALRSIRSEAARPISLLVLAHEHENQNLRETAIKTLGAIGTSGDAAILRELSAHENIARFGRQAATRALAVLEKRHAAHSEPGPRGETESSARPFDVALSFAGEDRKIAERLAFGLRSKGLRIFYDAFYEADLIGEDLSRLLPKIYGEASHFCLVIVSKHYPIKAWPRAELGRMRERAVFDTKSFLLPVRLDDTKLDGLPETIGYLDLRTRSVEEAIELIYRKVNSASSGGLSNLMV